MLLDQMTGEPRACIDEIERGNLQNYTSSIRVTQTCQLSQEEGGACGVPGTQRLLSVNQDFTLDVNDETCSSGARLRLQEPPPAGSKLAIDLRFNQEALFD